jgi:hypothetical protein
MKTLPNSSASPITEKATVIDEGMNARYRFKAHAVCVPDEWLKYDAPPTPTRLPLPRTTGAITKPRQS